MKQVWLRFYAELNDFLSPEKRFQRFPVQFYVGPTVRDLIESQGVPHTEVDLILVDGESSGLDRIVEGGERISVYPVFEALDITEVSRVRPEPLRDPKFILDVHLGRLAAYLRMAGFDTVYANDAQDEDLARSSAEGRRILLTRDLGLLKRGAVTRGYYVRETSPLRQLQEVVRRFELKRLLRPFSRCMACNSELSHAPKESVRGRVPDEVLSKYDDFDECATCGRVFWKGSHYDRMQRIVTGL